MGLVILAKVPEEGRVKTRLRLPPGPTLALHRAMAADVRDACVAAGARPAWAIAGDLGHPWVKGLEALGDRVLPQAGGDLGARIEAALMAADRPGNAVALGMDSPTLPPELLRRALDAPEDLTLGPAFDGGYWLIGWRQPRPGLLRRGIPWSAPDTLAATAAAARAAGLSVGLLPFWYDVDTPGDLVFLRNHLRALPPGVAPRTREALSAV